MEDIGDGEKDVTGQDSGESPLLGSSGKSEGDYEEDPAGKESFKKNASPTCSGKVNLRDN